MEKVRILEIKESVFADNDRGDSDEDVAASGT